MKIVSVILNCEDGIIQMLIEKGADLGIADKRGFDFNKHCRLANRKEFLAKK